MIRSLITSLFILCTAISVAQGSDLEKSFRERLKLQSNLNKTIVCQFTQTKKVKNIKNSVITNGDFFYDNMGMMALIYKEPAGDKLIMKNSSFSITAGGKTFAVDASSNPMMAQISTMMQACMSGAVSDLGRGWKMDVKEGDAAIVVTLVPEDRRIRKYLSSMRMDFDDENLTLNILRIDETSGGFTEYKFFDKKLNQKLDEAVFNN